MAGPARRAGPAIQLTAGLVVAGSAARPWVALTVSLGGATPHSDIDRGIDLASGRVVLALAVALGVVALLRLVWPVPAAAPLALSTALLAASTAGALRLAARLNDLAESARALGGSATGRLRDGVFLAITGAAVASAGTVVSWARARRAGRVLE